MRGLDPPPSIPEVHKNSIKYLNDNLRILCWNRPEGPHQKIFPKHEWYNSSILRGSVCKVLSWGIVELLYPFEANSVRIHTLSLIPSASETGIRFNNSGLNAGEMEAADSITLLLYTVAVRVSHAVFTRETKKYDPTKYFVLRNPPCSSVEF